MLKIIRQSEVYLMNEAVTDTFTRPGAQEEALMEDLVRQHNTHHHSHQVVEERPHKKKDDAVSLAEKNSHSTGHIIDIKTSHN